MNEIYAGNKTDGTISQGTSLTVTGTDAILGKADGDNWTCYHGRNSIQEWLMQNGMTGKNRYDFYQ